MEKFCSSGNHSNPSAFLKAVGMSSPSLCAVISALSSVPITPNVGSQVGKGDLKREFSHSCALYQLLTTSGGLDHTLYSLAEGCGSQSAKHVISYSTNELAPGS